MRTTARWAFWRRVQYAILFFMTTGLLATTVFFSYFYIPGNCFDQTQNSIERGIDCGGGCVRICAAEIIPPTIVWAESFQIVDGQYNSVAYLENKNAEASTKALPYIFELYNEDTLVTTREGTTVLPPSSVYPVFEGRIDTKGQPITKTIIKLADSAIWQPATLGREQFKTTDVLLKNADVRPRLEANINNQEITEAKDIEVVATLFNVNGRPITASQTFIESLKGKIGKDIVFTWPQPLTKTVRSCLIPTDVVVGVDLSGSMNSDSLNPPQPLTDALKSAESFVQRLGDQDQVALVTFGSLADTVRTLSKNHQEVAQVVSTLTITPADEVGYTNTAAALKAARVELQSERHSNDSRRVLVLLTDGLPTASGDQSQILAATVSEAKQLREVGVEVYVVGLGKGVNKDFVASLVSDQEHAYYAASSQELDSIYTEITSSLCESGTTRIDVIAKTPTNFVPLQK